MHVTRRLILITLLYKSVESANWRMKGKEKVRVSIIMSVEKDISLISCQIKCNLQKECYEIGTDENIGLGMVGDCYFLRKSDYSDSGQTSSIFSMKDMYVYNKNDLPRCRADQNEVISGAGYTCVCKNGLITEDSKHPLSCDAIKKSNQIAPSGFYTINPSKPVSVYCDMDIDDNGWMAISNITLPNAISVSYATTLASYESLSNDIGKLKEVSTGLFRFNPVHLDDFEASFRYIHFYCKKPGGRTVSISTINKDVLDYYMLKSNIAPAACSSFERLPKDNSYLGQRCDWWQSNTWKMRENYGNGFYNFPFFVGNKYHYGMHKGRYECDDMHGTIAGVWRAYVR